MADYSKKGISKKKLLCFESSLLGQCRWEVVLLFALIQPVLIGLAEYPAASYVSVITIILYLYYIINERPYFVFKYLACIFALCANIVGCAAIELFNPIWLIELQVYSSYVGSLPILVFGWWLFLSILYVFDSYKGVELSYSERKPINGKLSDALTYLSLAVLALTLIVFLRVLPYPSFAFGMDRFVYKATYIGGVWSTIANILAYLIVIPILSFREKGHALSLLAVAVYCLYLFWTGCKFGEFFGVACTFCFVFFDKIIQIRLDMAKRAVRYAAVACVAIVLFAGFAHSFTSEKSYEDFFTTRTAAQGQLWWSTYSQSNSWHINQFIDSELTALFDDREVTDSIGEMHGIYRIMYQSAPASRVDSKLSTGSVYTEAGFACAYYYFGIAGVIAFAVLMGILIAVIVNGLLKALRDFNIIRALVILRLNSVTLSVMSMFLFSRLLTTRSLLCVLYLVVEPFFIKAYRKRKGPKEASSRNSFE